MSDAYRRSNRQARLTLSAIGVLVCGVVALVDSGCAHSADPGATTATTASAAATTEGGSPVRQAQAAQQSEMGKRQQQMMQQAQAHGAAPGSAKTN